MRWYVLLRVLVTVAALAALAFGWPGSPGPPILPFILTTGVDMDHPVVQEDRPP